MKAENREMSQSLASKEASIHSIQQQLEEKSHECSVLSRQLQQTLDDVQKQVQTRGVTEVSQFHKTPHTRRLNGLAICNELKGFSIKTVALLQLLNSYQDAAELVRRITVKGNACKRSDLTGSITHYPGLPKVFSSDLEDVKRLPWLLVLNTLAFLKQVTFGVLV